MTAKKNGKATKKITGSKKQNRRKAAVKPPRTETASIKASRKRTIRQVVIETITANAAVINAEMIAAVKKEFPESAFKDTHAAWYRSQARKGSLTGTPISIPVIGRKQYKTSD